MKKLTKRLLVEMAVNKAKGENMANLWDGGMPSNQPTNLWGGSLASSNQNTSGFNATFQSSGDSIYDQDLIQDRTRRSL